jgi:Glycosyl-hydrolase 97 N-terminal
LGIGSTGFSLCCLNVVFVAATQAQDAHTLKSPDGQTEFRLFVNQSPEGALPRIAYQLFYRGKPVIETSYLGFDIQDQEPLLGEKAGLTHWSSKEGEMLAEYMQDGSIGRRINIEVKIQNESVAFRYIIPRTTPLEELQIADELTEFALATNAPGPVAQIPGAGWIAIAEHGNDGSYPPMKLVKSATGILVTHLTKTWESITPFTSPWRVIGIGSSETQARSAASSASPAP